MGLDIGSLHAEVPDDLPDTGIVFREKFSQGLAPVKEEAFAGGGIADDFPRQHRHPGEKVIAPAPPEFFRQGRGPGFRIGLITVNQQVRDSLLPQQAAGGLFVHVQVGVEIALPGVFVQFVHLQAGGVGRGGVVHLAGERGPEAVNPPVPFSQAADQPPVRGHPVCEDDDIFRPDAFLPAFRRRREAVKIVGEAVTCLLLEHFYLAHPVQLQGLGLFSRNPVVAGLGGRDVHGDVSQRRLPDAADGFPVFPVLAALKLGIGIDVPFPGPISAGVPLGREGADLAGTRETHGDAVGIAGDPAPHLFHAHIGVGKPHGHHGHIVAVVLHFHAMRRVVRQVPVLPRYLAEFGKDLVDIPALHVHGLPLQFFHGIFGRYPRTARAAPSRSAGHGGLQAQGIGQGNGIAVGLFPTFGQIRPLEGGRLGHIDPSGVKLMETGDPHAVHPQEVFPNAFQAHFPIHPMPPHIRPGGAGGVLKRLDQAVRSTCRGSRCKKQGKKKGGNHNCGYCLFTNIILSCVLPNTAGETGLFSGTIIAG